VPLHDGEALVERGGGRHGDGAPHDDRSRVHALGDDVHAEAHLVHGVGGERPDRAVGAAVVREQSQVTVERSLASQTVERRPEHRRAGEEDPVRRETLDELQRRRRVRVGVLVTRRARLHPGDRGGVHIPEGAGRARPARAPPTRAASRSAT
jgi:hypothetical protein